jgi:predicted RNA-binding protein associated with RNAse of E/G family
MASLSGLPVTVHKLYSTDGREITWSGPVVAHDAEHLVLEATWTRGPLDLGLLVFEPGDLFRETYYFDRWWNVYEIHGGTGALRGWYCNISRPARLIGSDLYYEDLALDILIAADGRARVDDEDEFAALQLDVHDPEAYREAQTAVAQIRALLAQRRPPFAALSAGSIAWQ